MSGYLFDDRKTNKRYIIDKIFYVYDNGHVELENYEVLDSMDKKRCTLVFYNKYDHLDKFENSFKKIEIKDKIETIQSEIMELENDLDNLR